MGAKNSASDFFDALPPEVQGEGYIACPQKFLEQDQHALSDTGFRVVLALAGETSLAKPIYEHPIAGLLPEKNRSSKVTKAIRELKKAGQLVNNEDGQPIDTSPFWGRWAGLGEPGGARYSRVSRWILNNHRTLGWTDRNLRVFVVVSSYYYEKQQMPFMSGKHLGAILGVSAAQGSKDLKALYEAGLDKAYPANAKAAFGYGFTTFLRRLGAMLAPAPATGPAITTTAPVPPAEVLDDDGSPFFGVAATTPATKKTRVGGTKRRKPKPKTGPAPSQDKPRDATGDERLAKIDRLAATRLLPWINEIDDRFREQGRDIAERAAAGQALTLKQREWLYRAAVRWVLEEPWKKFESLNSLADRLDVALDPPRFSAQRVGSTSVTYFGKKLGMLEAVEIGRQCRTQGEVIALLLAKGNTPVCPLPEPEEPRPKGQQWSNPKGPTREELLDAHFAQRDHSDRSIVITKIGHRDRSAATLGGSFLVGGFLLATRRAL